MLRFLPTVPASYRPGSRFFDRGIFFAPEGDQGTTPPPVASDPVVAMTTAFKSLSEQRGGTEPAALFLMQRYAQLEQQIETLKAKQIPNGAIVLTGDQVALWEALKSYKPDDVAAALQERDTLKSQIATVEREKLITRAAEAAGYKASVLAKLPDLPAIEVTEKDGKPVADVVKDGARTPLADYVTANYADFLPSLQQQSQQSPQPTGIPFPNQTGRSSNGGDIVANFIQQQNERAAAAPNALARK